MTRYRFAIGFLMMAGLLWGPLVGTATGQIDELPRPDSADGRSFGVSVALTDSIAAVGASGEAACGPNAGAVYVYERASAPTRGAWQGTARITPNTCRANTFFGERVVLSGRRLFVSAASSESAADAATNEAYMFRRSPSGDWQQTARFHGTGNHKDGTFATDIDVDGDLAVVSTSGRPDRAIGGAVYVYAYESTSETWQLSTRLTASHGVQAGVMGRGIAVSGDHLAVAASTYFEREPGSVYVFNRAAPGEWKEVALLRGIESFFTELDLDGSRLIVGEDRALDDRSGRATLYADREPAGWEQVATLRPAFPYDSGAFGTGVALDRNWALATGYGEQLDKAFNIDRVVYAFERDGPNTWRQRTILDIGEVGFGAALDIHRSMALVSSVPSGRPGSAYVVYLP